MKKSSVILTSVVCGGLLLLGCTTPSTPANVAKSLESNLNCLTTTINKLDTIDNSYLSNPDIYPITNSITTPAPNLNKKSIAKVSANNLNVFIPIESNKRKIAKTLVNLESEQTTIETQDVVINNFETPADIATNDTAKEKTTKDVTNIDTENNETEPQTIIYYHESRPIRYAPRYSRQNIENEDYLTNYISKVKNLYAITNDAIVANNELNNYKDNVIAYCVEIKDLNSAIKDGTFVPSTQQIAALNNYIDDIKITIKRIKKCNGDLSDEVDSINKTDVGGITAGIDVINSNYLSVLNHLDTRITYLKNALTTLEQIKYLLQEAENIVEINPEVSEQVVTEEIVTPNNSELETDVNNETFEVNDNETSSSNNENVTANNNEQIIEDNLAEEEAATNSETTDTENIIETEDTAETTSESDISTADDSETGLSNIDTYLNTNNNLDTYSNAVDNNNTNLETETDVNTAINNNEPNNKLNQVTNGVNAPAINNGVNNGYLLPTDSEKINAPNGTFQNGIITQNNLNNGVNSGVNGNFSGYAGSYNYPAANGDNTRTNKNVDTYGRNTMIDMLNHGTVNNGINTLSVAEETTVKPSMVSSETIIGDEKNSNKNLENDCINCESVKECEECLDSNECENCEEQLEECEDCLEIKKSAEQIETCESHTTEQQTLELEQKNNVELNETINELAAPKQDNYNAELL